MKKQMIAAAILSAVVCLTGCSININDETVSQEVNNTSSVLEETGTNVNVQSVDASLDSNVNQTQTNAVSVTAVNQQTTAATTETVSQNAANAFGFYRVTEMPPVGISVADLEGEWNNTLNQDWILTFYDCGLYSGSYSLNDSGKVTTGKVYLEYNYYPGDSQVFWYNLYSNDNDYPFSLAADGMIPLNELYPLEQDNGYYVRNFGADYPFNEYLGTWQSDTQWNGCDFNIQIRKAGDLMDVIVSAHSAVADYEWKYSCTCSDDGTYIECIDGGALYRTDYAPNGDILDPVTVYTDGTAKFNIKGGVLFWQECEEDTARQVGFRKIG